MNSNEQTRVGCRPLTCERNAQKPAMEAEGPGHEEGPIYDDVLKYSA